MAAIGSGCGDRESQLAAVSSGKCMGCMPAGIVCQGPLVEL